MPKLPKGLPKFLTDEERAKIIEHWLEPTATNSRNLAIFLLGLDTGLRVSESAALKLTDVDFRRNEVRVWGKGAKERQAGFGKKTASRVRSYVDFHRRRVADEHLSEDRLFLCHTGHGADGRETIGEPLSEHGIKLIFRRLSAKLDIHVTPHMLRHTFAHDFLANGGSVADLQRLLGHESPETSLWYARVFNGDALERQKANSVVDKQFQRSRQRV